MRSSALVFVAVAVLLVLPGCREGGREAAISQPRSDLSGVWIGPATTLEPPAPMTPRAQALFDAARPLFGPRSVPVANSNDPLVTCDPLAILRSIFLRAPLSGMELVQTPQWVLQLFRYQRA